MMYTKACGSVYTESRRHSFQRSLRYYLPVEMSHDCFAVCDGEIEKGVGSILRISSIILGYARNYHTYDTIDMASYIFRSTLFLHPTKTFRKC
jgi:hypothetical protein